MRSGFEGCVNAAEDFDANQSDKIVETTSRLSVAFKAMPEPDESLSFEGDEDRFDKVPAEIADVTLISGFLRAARLCR